MLLIWLTTLGILAAPVFLVAKTRSFLIAVSVPLLSVLATGIIIQSTNWNNTIHWTANSIRCLFVILNGAASLLAVRTVGTPVQRPWLRQVLAVGVPSLGILLVMIAARVGAKHQVHGLLSNILYLTSEDNAKWTNVASLIVQGKAIGIFSIGGVTTTCLVLCETLLSALFPIIGLSKNEISLSISTVISGQLLLIILAPLVLLPLTKLLNIDRYSWKAIPGFWLSSFIIAGGSAALANLGHLSSQLVLLVGVYSICILLTSEASQKNAELNFFLGLLCVTATASIWLPIQLLTAVVPVVAVSVFITRRIKKNSNQVFNPLICAPLLLTIAAIPIAIDSFNYLTVTKTNFQNLLVAGGATNTVTPILSLLPFVLICALLAGRERLRVDGAVTIFSGKSNENFGVLSLVALITLSVLFVDYFRTGSSHYGSQKVQYMCALLLIITMIPIAIAKLTDAELPVRGFMLSGGCSLLLLLALSSDPTFSSLTQRFRAQQWPSISLDPKDATWQAYVTSLSINGGTLAELPIACGEIVELKRYWTVDFNTYLCTRSLVALAGLEIDGGPLVEWQLRSDWKRSLNYLREMPESVKTRNILILHHGIVLYTGRIDIYFDNRGFQR